MRLFIFGIGGTGARILNALVMQLATGAQLRDPSGQPVTSVVPILIDPHASNAGLDGADCNLGIYRDIHRRLYGDTPPQEGFFATKLQSLRELLNANANTRDTFKFSLSRVSQSRFSDFIDLRNLAPEDRQVAQTLFSEQELNTLMSEGFYGAPNIGCVALSEFINTPDFESLRNVFQQGDKMFFAGSIFGGTGAAGLPLMISSIRNLSQSSLPNALLCAQAPIGALIVTPYFKIDSDASSRINYSDFIGKTKSALKYYANNLNKRINNVYYIGDDLETTGFENDPGNKNNQAGNKAHMVEFAGAEAVFDFARSNSGGVGLDGRVYHGEYKAYYLRDEARLVSMASLPRTTKELLRDPLMRFQLAKLFLENKLGDNLREPFALKHQPAIDRSAFGEDLQRFFRAFDTWMYEMGSHGPTAHNLDLYNAATGDDYSNIYTGIQPKKGAFWGFRSLTVKDLVKALNETANEMGAQALFGGTAEQRLMATLYRATGKAITDCFDLN